ncbi:MAG: hypothetical protein Q7S33_05580 [Nanoarchaeota archaeon]|nr:hypothetical protein [Nanoarchaeota archaeon]
MNLKKSLVALALTTALSASCFFSLSLSPNLSGQHEKNNHPDYSHMSYKKLIKEIKTPEQVTDYLLDCIEYEPSDFSFVRSFRRVNREHKADCIEASISAGALLSDDGYDLKYLWMFNDNPENGRAVYFYVGNAISDHLKNPKLKQEGFSDQDKSKLYGTLGIFQEDNNLPRFSDLREISDFFYFQNYIPMKIDEFMIDDFFGAIR